MNVKILLDSQEWVSPKKERTTHPRAKGIRFEVKIKFSTVSLVLWPWASHASLILSILSWKGGGGRDAISHFTGDYKMVYCMVGEATS